MPDRRPEVNLCDADPLARALARLRPAPAAVDLPTLMYQAGRASRDRSVARWRRAALTAGLGLLGTWTAVYVGGDRLRDRPAVVVVAPAKAAVVLPASPESAPMPREILLPEPSAWPAPPPVAADPSGLREYLRVRNGVLASGLTALPNVAPAPALPGGPSRSPADFERSLHLPRGVLAVPYYFPTPGPHPD